MNPKLKSHILDACIAAAMALFLFSVTLAFAINGNVPSQLIINKITCGQVFNITEKGDLK